jgi:gamma-glutamyltranspeptidase/glutathione hydrolase
MRDFSFPGRSPVYGVSGMAATSMPAATLTALDVLRAGGNAVDAAVAAAAVLAVIEPQSTGIGGDCFCLYAPAGGDRIVAINGSGRAATGYTVDRFHSGTITLSSGAAHAVTIPGALSAWETLLSSYGTRGLDALLQPAIGFAEHGWPVHARVSRDWSEQVDKLRAGGADLFVPGGSAPAPGTLFRQTALAATLRAVAARGARAFYEGEVAADMVAALQARGGLQTEADFFDGLKGAMFVEPIGADWRGYRVWECPPNGSGVIALMLLGILERLGEAPGGPLSVTRLHRHVEAARLVYRDRDAFVADPAQEAVRAEGLLDPAYLDGLASLIDDERAMTAMPPAGHTEPAHRDTVILAVVDRDGNACSFINSTFESFGSGILAPRSGVMLHNRGLGFSVEPGHPNCIAPGKRPMHTILPAMLSKDGRAVMPFGVMGGHFQPMGQTLFLSNLLEQGLDIQEALDLPRLFPFRGRVEVEASMPDAVAAGLASLGHDPFVMGGSHGGGQAIWIDHARGVLVGGSDPRKDGMALGY